MADVPCAGCTACCRGEYVVLFPERGDNPAAFEHTAIDTPHGKLLVVNHRPNGDCVYLGDNGCTIHGRAPIVCQEFDCRRYFLSMTRIERRQFEKHARAKVEIFAAARKRLASLSPAEHAEACAHRAIARPEVSDRRRLRDALLGTTEAH